MTTARVRRQLWIGLVVGVLLTVVGVLAPTRAHACSCAYPATDSRLLDTAAVIFAGDLSSDRLILFGRTREITFRVARVYKGSATAVQRVRTDPSGASCGLEIAGAGRYVVFAQRHNGDQLTANLCGGTRPGPAPAALGAGAPPKPGSDQEFDARSVVLASSAVVLAAAGALLVRNRRRLPRP